MVTIVRYEVVYVGDLKKDDEFPKYEWWDWNEDGSYDAGWSWPPNALYKFVDGKPVELIETDGGEPEDQTFTRDWSWVAGELNKAYGEGYQAGREYGYEDGHSDGYDDGYSDGYDEGVSA